jgi:hypothetical protein
MKYPEDEEDEPEDLTVDLVEDLVEADAVEVISPSGTMITSPGERMLFADTSLKARMSCMSALYLEAIDARVSPFLTVWRTPEIGKITSSWPSFIVLPLMSFAHAIVFEDTPNIWAISGKVSPLRTIYTEIWPVPDLPVSTNSTPSPMGDKALPSTIAKWAEESGVLYVFKWLSSRAIVWELFSCMTSGARKNLTPWDLARATPGKHTTANRPRTNVALPKVAI